MPRTARTYREGAMCSRGTRAKLLTPTLAAAAMVALVTAAAATAIAPAGATIPYAAGARVPEVPDLELSVTDGSVECIAPSANGSVYVAGEFTRVYPYTGSCVLIDRATGVAQSPYLQVDGIVHAALPDGEGGFYIGGEFTEVAGVKRNLLAHIKADGALDPAWDAKVEGATVFALARTGPAIVVGGYFSKIGGQVRNNLASVWVSSGEPTSWDPDANAAVTDIEVDSSKVYVAGDFTTIGGQPRSKIAALQAYSGTLLPWNPGANYQVSSIAPSGSIVYVGGAFTSIGGQSRNCIAALDASTGNATAWNPNANSDVFALSVSGSTVYVGGQFTSIGGQSRNRIAALDASTGNATAWNPSSTGEVYAIDASGSTVFTAGNFATIGGQSRLRIAELSKSTGNATAWNPGADREVLKIQPVGTKVYVAGCFNSTGGQSRNCIAALDASTGNATPWNPNADSYVYGLAMGEDSTVYVGGAFGSVGGQPRYRIGALDPSTGNATSWRPLVYGASPSSGNVMALAASGPRVYVGGGFTAVGGRNRKGFACFTTPPTAATLSCERSTAIVPYGGTLTVLGALTDGTGSGVGSTSRPVKLYRSTNYAATSPTYAYAGDASFDPSAGTYTVTPPGLTSNTAFHLRYEGDERYLPCQSRNVVVLAQARMYMPVMSTYAPRRYRIFTVAGCFRPGHTGKTRIEFYRWVRSGYRLYRCYYGTNSRLSSSLTKYTLRTRLPYRGYWRLRARHWDSGHAKTYSSWRCFRVR